MQKKHKVVVYRGRFQGLHDAHVKSILFGLSLAEKVIVVVGSANEPRTYYRNPFYENERIEMIHGALEEHFRHSDVHFTTVEDNPDDHVWASNVVEQVETVALAIFGEHVPIAQIGFKKDANCVRDVDLFPEWEYIDTPHFEPLDATQVRDVLFSKKPLGFLKGVCPQPVIEYLKGFRVSEDFANMMAEKKFVEDYQKQFAGLEYAPTFVTGDNVPFRDGHVLLVRRKGHPGKGLWALAAGFFNAADRITKSGEVVKADKNVFACAVRELFEETKAQLTKEQLQAALLGVKLLDAEGRDPRGRILTHVHAYDLDAYDDFSIEASDDAEEVRWWPVSEVTRRMMYADHYDAIQWAYQLYFYNFV